MSSSHALHQRRARRLVPMIGLGLLALTTTPAAHATNFSGASGGTSCSNNMADGRSHSFAYNTITTPTRAAVDWSRANNYDPTEIDTFNEPVNAGTDVVVHDDDLSGVQCGQTWISSIGGGGMVGIALCQTANGAKRSEQSRVYFDTQYMGPRSDAAEQTLE